MKLETVISFVILASVAAVLLLPSEFGATFLQGIGALAIGWHIPSVAKYIAAKIKQPRTNEV